MTNSIKMWSPERRVDGYSSENLGLTSPDRLHAGIVLLQAGLF